MCFEKGLEFGNAECRHDVEVVIQDFIDDVLDLPVTEKDDHILIAAAFAMRLAARAGRDIAADLAHLLEIAVCPIDAQFPLQNQGPISGPVPVQNDLFAGRELEEQIDDPALRINIADVIGKVVETLDRFPDDIAVVECRRRHRFPP